MTSSFVKLTRAYQRALVRHPFIVQAIQVSILMGTGDIIAQTIVEKNHIRNVDLVWTTKFASIGFVIGPVLRFWFGKLDVIVKTKQPIRRAVTKMLLDQCCFAPVIIAFLTTLLSALQGMNEEEIIARLKRDYFNIMKANYMLWPAAQFINFSLMPLNYQVVFNQCIAVMWNTYLSYKLANIFKK